MTPNPGMVFGGRIPGECRRLSPERDITVENLFTIPGVVVGLPDETRADQLKELFVDAMKIAFESFSSERRKEGEKLAEAIDLIAHEMERSLDQIRGASEDIVEKYRQRLHERMEDLLGPRMASLDPGRLEQEVAIFTDKADINEEIVRLESHLGNLRGMIAKKGEPIGRKIEFLAQEILRETNTIGSKCRDLDITREVLNLKNLCENLREQIANVS